MWGFNYQEGFERSAKGFVKNTRAQFNQAIDNVTDLVAALNSGSTIQQATQRRCYHNEGQGLFAADQSPPHKGVVELRLYLYPDASTKTVHLIRLGEKASQQRDLLKCRPIVDQIKRKGNGSD